MILSGEKGGFGGCEKGVSGASVGWKGSQGVERGLCGIWGGEGVSGASVGCKGHQGAESGGWGAWGGRGERDFRGEKGGLGVEREVGRENWGSWGGFYGT